MNIKEKAQAGKPKVVAYLNNLRSDIEAKIESLEEKKKSAANCSIMDNLNKYGLANRKFIIDDYVSTKKCFEPIEKDLMWLREMLSELEDLFFEVGIDW